MVTFGRAEFVGAVATPGGPPPSRLPQVAIIGRSNVGKSSLINALLGRKALARVSKTPGRTQEIHFYEIEDRFCLVDLPGYGFARVPAEVRQRWAPLIETYLSTSPDLVGVVLLLDARHGPSKHDRSMLDFLTRLGVPTLFVLTKADKLSRAKRLRALEETRCALDIPEDQILATSALTGEGTETLGRSLLSVVEEAGT